MGLICEESIWLHTLYGKLLGELSTAWAIYHTLEFVA